MTKGSAQPMRGRPGGGWPLLLGALLAVALPTACTLYFLNAAVRNERLAVRQRFADVYRARATGAQQLLYAKWAETATSVEAEASSFPAPQAFARIVCAKLADTVIIMRSDEQPSFPLFHAAVGPGPASDAKFAEAEKSERAGGDPLVTAARGNTVTADVLIRAVIGQARSLARAGAAAGACDALRAMIEDPAGAATFTSFRDDRGDFPYWNAVLLYLEYSPDRTTPQFAAMAGLLAARLKDYSRDLLSSAQRRFLITALREVSPGSVDDELRALLAAEQTAADCLNDTASYGVEAQSLRAEYIGRPPVPRSSSAVLCRTAGGLYRLTTAWPPAADKERAVVLLSEAGVLERAGAWLEDAGLGVTGEGATFGLVPPGKSGAGDAFLSMPAAECMPGWRLEVRLVGDDPFKEAAGRQVTVYIWTGAIAVLAVALLSALVVRYINRQARLARLKNDLVATVSHELKTPLASMRVLVDTLVEGRVSGDAQGREYLGLISRENERLTHLIDNFLTFSRMERSKRAFVPAATSVTEVVEAAARLVRDRCTTPDCRLDVSVAGGMPPIHTDRDAIVTVLVNLLDNAIKYTGDRKEISVRAYADAGRACIEVADNGIGISARDRKRIFDRFYQVDQSLARRAGGCGLGLAIVKYILDAHNGTIEVDGVPGKGSTFRVTLPLELNGADAKEK